MNKLVLVHRKNCLHEFTTRQILLQTVIANRRYFLRITSDRQCCVTYKMDEAGGGEPDSEEDCDELHKSDAVTRSQDVHVL